MRGTLRWTDGEYSIRTRPGYKKDEDEIIEHQTLDGKWIKVSIESLLWMVHLLSQNEGILYSCRGKGGESLMDYFKLATEDIENAVFQLRHRIAESKARWGFHGRV